jgi:outer membrane receptor protein involved in Fe transport
MKTSALVCCVFIGCFAASTALARGLCVNTRQVTTDDDINALITESIEELMSRTITTASKHEESRDCSPATTLVITAEQIRERHYVNLVDLLEDVPSVNIQRASRSSSYNNVSIRGHVNSNTFLILQDGVRIDSPMGGEIPMADNFPLYHAKQVEILMGPVAALYGADAFAGVINIITEDEKPRHSTAAVSVSQGRDDYKYYQGLGVLRFNDKVSLTLSGHSHQTDNDDLAALYPAQFAKVDARTFAGDVVIPAREREDYQGGVKSNSAFLKLNLGDDLTLGYQHSFFSSLTSTGDLPSTALYLPQGQWNTQIDTAYLKYKTDLSDRLSTELLLNYSRFEVDPLSKYQNIYVNFADDGYQYAKGDKRSISQQFNYLLSDEHLLLGGVVYDNLYALPQTPSLPQPYDRNRSPQDQGLYYSNTDIPIPILDMTYHNTALYAQLQSNWNERLSTTLGLRYDNNSRYDASLNPRLGLVYRLSEQTTLRGLYGEAFRAPSPKESFSTYGSFSGEQDEQGRYIGIKFRSPNFDLQPEKSRSLSVGVDHLFNADLHLSANAYYTQVDNLIVSQDEAVPIQYIPNAILSQSSVKENAGEEQHYGFDLILSAQRRFSAQWQASLWGSYSFADGSIKDSVQGMAWDLPYLSRHKIKLGSTWRYLQKYVITPQLYLIGSTNSARQDKHNLGHRIKTAGYVLGHLHLGAENVLPNLSAYLSFYNLFDTRYYAAAGSSSTTFTAMPQAGRSVIFSLRYQF